jgi:hypothetical protein
MSEEMNDIEPEKKPKPSSINNAKKAREQRQRNVIEKKRKDAERYLKRTAGDENRSASEPIDEKRSNESDDDSDTEVITIRTSKVKRAKPQVVDDKPQVVDDKPQVVDDKPQVAGNGEYYSQTIPNYGRPQVAGNGECYSQTIPNYARPQVAYARPQVAYGRPTEQTASSLLPSEKTETKSTNQPNKEEMEKYLNDLKRRDINAYMNALRTRIINHK